MHIDLRQIRHFVALAEHRSFVGAAKAVFLSQSAFSRSIQGLEQSIGFKLVDRAAKDLALSEQGVIVLEYARRLLKNAEVLSSELDNFKDTETGSIYIGCGPAPATQLIPHAAAKFIGDYPKAQVHIKVDNWQELAKRLASKEIEFFVAAIRLIATDPSYKVEPLKPQTWSFFCSLNHPLADQESVSLTEVLSYPLACTFAPPNIRKILKAQIGRAEFVPAIECEHGHVLLNIIRNSDAIGILQTSSFNEYPVQSEIKALEIRDFPGKLGPRISYGIVSRASDQLSPLAVALIEQIKDTDLGTEHPTA